MRFIALLLLFCVSAGAAELNISWTATPGHESVFYCFTNSVATTTAPLVGWHYRAPAGTNTTARVRVPSGWWLFLVTSITTNGVESMPAIPLYYVKEL